MMNVGRTLGAGLILAALSVGLAGCQKQEGPAEHAGKEVDKAMQKAGEQIEKAGESIQDAARGEKKDKQ